MGEVYRARDVRLGRAVALKVLPPEFAEDAERLRRFEQEARTASALNHPGIVVVHDVGTQDGVSFLVQELVEGETLGSALRRGALPVRKAVDYAVQVARGLAAAHAQGIIHRDLKPENFIVTQDGHVKILDFGLAKAAPVFAPEQTTMTGSPALHTSPGVILGTLGYMSPEQLRGQAADTRSDLFSFGAVLYEMLAGRRPFAGDTAADTASAILGQDPAELVATGHVVPAGIERIVMRCLAKRPEERFQSARDLAFALEGLSETTSGSGGVPARPAAKRRRPWLALAGAGAAVVALGAFALALARRPPAANLVAARFTVMLPGGASASRFATANSLALSPDGRQLALVAITGGRPVLWVRVLDNMVPTPLEGTEGAASPFWSPDGRAIAFFAGGKLKKIAVSGGPAETICDAAFGSSGTWGPDGTVLYTEWGGEREGLYRVSSRGGTPSALELRTAAGPEVGIAWPAFLPDGRRFVYLSGSFARRPTRTIAVASVDSPEARHAAAADSQPVPVAGSRLLFVREGTLLAQTFDPGGARLLGDPTPLVDLVWYLRPSGSAEFTASPDGRVLAFREPPSPGRLAWLDRSGREVGAVGPAGFVDNPRISPDGTRVAFEVADPRAGGNDVWIHDLARGVRSRFTLDPLDANQPVWSPDGERLLYGSSAHGRPLHMMIKRADGSGSEEEVVRTNEAQLPQDWSPDGRWILFGDQSPARRPRRQLWLLPLEGERRPEPLESAPVSRYDGRFSPDGRSVAFVSEETGRPEVFIAPLRRPGPRQQVSTEGGLAPRWRKDGRELYYFSSQGQLTAVALDASPDLRAAPPRPLFSLETSPGWASAGGGAAVRYDVDTRGERFLCVVGPGSLPPIVVAIGWDVARKE